jgi:hypothetical protein
MEILEQNIWGFSQAEDVFFQLQNTRFFHQPTREITSFWMILPWSTRASPQKRNPTSGHP